MKAITICQPYPELILRGDKRVENRNQFWRYRGPILIHAGKSREWLRLNERGTVDQFGIAVAQMTFGAIVGLCDIVDCVRPIRYITEPYQRRIAIFGKQVEAKYPWLADHVHAEGEYCLILDNVRRFEQPIPARGMLGLWEFDGALPALPALPKLAVATA